MAERVRTYLDSSVWIAVANGEGSWEEAAQVIESPHRVILASRVVVLESVPGNLRTGRRDRAAAILQLLSRVVEWIPLSDATLDAAIDLKSNHDLTHLDAIHLALAAQAKAEFVTLERPKRPMFQVRGVKVVHVRDAAAP